MSAWTLEDVRRVLAEIYPSSQYTLHQLRDSSSKDATLHKGTLYADVSAVEPPHEEWVLVLEDWAQEHTTVDLDHIESKLSFIEILHANLDERWTYRQRDKAQKK